MLVYKQGKDILTITEKGYGKRTDVSEYKVQNRNGKGIKAGIFNEKTGRLVGADKGAVTSDREFESMASWGLTNTMEEFANARADDMEAKNFMYNQINTTGMFKLKDVPKTVDAQLSKNLLNVYLMGAHISSNLINKDNYTFHTLRKNKKMITRS